MRATAPCSAYDVAEPSGDGLAGALEAGAVAVEREGGVRGDEHGVELEGQLARVEVLGQLAAIARVDRGEQAAAGEDLLIDVIEEPLAGSAKPLDASGCAQGGRAERLCGTADSLRRRVELQLTYPG